MVVSTLLHLILIALAVRATGLTAATRTTPDVVPVVYEIQRVDLRPAPPAPPISRLDPPDMPTLPGQGPDDLLVVISTDIPSTIPEPGAMKEPIESVFTLGRVSSTGQPSGSPNVAAGSPFSEWQVEKAVVAIPGTTPRYPSMLQSAGVEGDVRAQFVVDTLGRVEQGSFRALESTNDLFVAAVRDALGRARFKPAEVGGRKVRQLVEQTFTFRISR